MDIAPVQRPLEPSDIPPERLAGSQLTEEQKLGEATRQFEAILLRQILENSQKPVIPSRYTDNSTAAGIYRDLVTSQLADNISKSGTLGLGKTLEQQFRRPDPAASAADRRRAQAPPVAHAGAAIAPLDFPAARPGRTGAKTEPLLPGGTVLK